MSTDAHLISLGFANGETSLEVQRFCIDEGLSRLFTVSVVALSPKPDIDLETIVGRPANLRLTTNNPTAPDRVWSGICSHFELSQAVAPSVGIATAERSTYRLTIRPALWVTTQRRENRIFQQKSLPVIVQRLLDEWKIKARWELKHEAVDPATAEGPGELYRKHDYVVQYGETDFQFICRLLERAGITFFFRFKGLSETEFVLSDAPQTGEPRSDLPIDCFDTPPLSPPPEYLTHVEVAHAVRPGTVTLRDYDFRRDYNHLLLGSSKDKAPAPEDFYEQYGYEPGGSLVDARKGGSPATPEADDRGIFARHDDGELARQAQLHLESLRKNRRWIRFQSNCPDLAPGVLFSMSRHPRQELTTGKQPRFLVTDAFSEGTAGGEWTYGGRAVFTDYPYVPDRVTPKPRIYGMQSAVVVGPPGEEIHTDEFGRVRVQFHWDREGSYDDKSSCWMRVSQEWAGVGFGTLLLPRVGQEVLVAFFEGDPDHPVVVGRAYNELTKVPYPLPQHKTRTTWKSDSSPSSDGFNELLFEDKQGSELVYLQAQRDLQKLVKQYETARTGANRVEIVGTDRSTVVGELDARMVGGRYLVQMMKPADAAKLKILTQEEPALSPTATTLEMVDERIIFTTGKATVAFDGKDIRFEAAGNVTLHAEKGDVIVEGKHVFVNTQSPAPAPKPGPFEALTPGTYASRAADRVAALSQQAKRTEQAVDLTAPEAAFDRTMPEAEIFDCHLVQTQVYCEHKNAPRMPDKDSGLLEVTTTALSDTLTLKAKRVGACRVGDQHPEWKISGPDGTEVFHGASLQYSIPSWKYLQVHKLFFWIPRISPKTYSIYVRACSGDAHYQVRMYPNDKLKFYIDGNALQKAEVFGWLRDAMAGLLTRCGTKNAPELMSDKTTGTTLAHTHTGRSEGKTGEVMSDASVKFELLKGRFGMEAQWTEWPDDHRAFWKWSFVAEFLPLIGVKAKIAITPHVPFPLNKLADGYLYIEVWGRIEASGKGERKTPDSVWKMAKPKFTAFGGLRIRIGAHIHLLSKKALCAEAFGETDVGIEATYDTNRGPLDRPAVKFYFVWKGFKVAVWITFSVGWKWAKFEKQVREEWQLVEGARKGPKIWEFGHSEAEQERV